MSKFLYFAYGSNLHPQWLRSRTPSAELLGTLCWQKRRLYFHKSGVDGSGKCNIVTSDSIDDVIYGAVYQVDVTEAQALDAAEDGYRRERLCIGEFDNMLVYIADEGLDGHLSPYSWYQDIVIAGARYHNFPQHYIDYLRAFDAIIDPDRKREKKHRAIVRPR